MKKIIMAARDPGGANTLIPLVAALEERGYQVLLCGKEAALQRYRQFGLEAVDIDGLIKTVDVAHWKKYLSSVQPDFIITGTSGQDFTERYLWQACHETGIPCMAILDQWMNYGIRFSRYRPDEISKYQQDPSHPYVPDMIAVMDEEAKEELRKLGIDEAEILVTGQPFFDFVLSRQANMDQEEARRIRQEIGVDPDDYLITFVSEPLSSEYDPDQAGASYLGYDEKTICRQVLGALRSIAPDSPRNISFLIKLHPREYHQNYEQVMKLAADGRLRAGIVKEIDAWSLLQVSDLVCGMSSMLLLEAVLLGRSVVSVQIGLSKDNPFILDRRGIVKSIMQPEELQASLRRIIIEGDDPQANWKIPMGAVGRVIDCLEECICRN